MIRSILKRYLADYQPTGLEKAGVPRFLLNDIVRYWRTIAVDYQAKRWDELFTSETLGDDAEGKKPKWGTRYVKLRSSRKLAYCGTLVAVLTPRLTSTQLDAGFLAEQFELPSLARMGQLIDHLDHEDDREALRQILLLADWFALSLADRDFRAEVDKIEHPRRPDTNETFSAARSKTLELQSWLERLFQSQRPLRVVDDSPMEGCEGPLCMSQLTGRYLLF